jgi:hypothetical protein
MGVDELYSARYTAVPWPRRDGPALTRDMDRELWATPHGAIKAAQRNKAELRGDRTLTFVEDGMRATLYLNDQYLLDGVAAQRGQTTTVVQYWDYRELGSIRFPMRMRQTVGSEPALEIEVREVHLNAR